MDHAPEHQPDAWEEDVPIYRVMGGEGFTVRAGTNYPVTRKGKSTLVIRVEFSGALGDLPAMDIASAVWNKLADRVQQGEAFQATAMLGSLDTVGTIPGNEPGWDEAVIFWFTPFANAARPALAIRTCYRQSIVAALKGILAKEKDRLRSGRVGSYLPDWNRIWFVDEWRAIPNVLGALVDAHLRLVFVSREGYPEAPPVASKEATCSQKTT